MKNYTDEELEAMGLTDEEREALLSDDHDDGQDDDDQDQDQGGDGGQDDDAANAGRDDGADDADDADTDDDADKDDTADAGDDDKAAAGRDDGADDKQDDEPVTQAQAQPYAPNLRSTVPEDLDEQLKGIASQKKALRQQYNDGDIDFEEYEAKRDELDDQRQQLRDIQVKAQIAQDLREDRWVNRDVAGFMAQHPEYKPGSALYRLLDDEVKNRQAEAEAAGKDPLDPNILIQAHQSIRQTLEKDLGLEPGAKPTKQTGKPPAKRDVPPTLANIPAADTEDTDGGKYAHLDRLMEDDYEKYEARLATMSEAEREAYMNSR